MASIHEIERKNAARLVEAGKELPSLSNVTLRERIRLAWNYKSGNSDMNTYYMGSMAQFSVMSRLGGAMIHDNFEETLEGASRKKLEDAYLYAFNYWLHASENPRSTCACCGAIIDPKTGKAT